MHVGQTHEQFGKPVVIIDSVMATITTEDAITLRRVTTQTVGANNVWFIRQKQHLSRTWADCMDSLGLHEMHADWYRVA